MTASDACRRPRSCLQLGLPSLLAAGIAAAGMLVTADAQEAAIEPSEYERGVLIQIEGPITPLLEQAFIRKLDAARAKKSDLVIVEIDSPGGFLDASLKIADLLSELDWARTVAYIPREALSGAAIVALGCDDILMGPTARIGDAGPIFQGKDALFRHAPEKIRSNLARRIRDLSEANGRPPALAEAMVDMDLVVYRVRSKSTGVERLMAEHEIADEDDPGDWEKLKPVPESREGHFLTLNGRRAVEFGLADALVDDRTELQQHYPTRQRLVVLRPTSVDTAVTILNLPLVTGLLFVIGLIALYIEFSAPGIGLGAMISGLCFALFFWSRFLGGTAGWLEVILFGAGMVFLAMEFFVIPGFGIAGISGMLLILASLLMASQSFVVPSTERELFTTFTSLGVVAGSAVGFLILAVALSNYFGSIPVIGWMVLAPPNSDEGTDEEPFDGKSSRTGSHGRFAVSAGDWGIADSPLRPAGRVRFGDDYVDVVTDGSYVDAGRQVRVVDISGNRVVVREVDESA